MTYRPRPDVDRARHQLDRHVHREAPRAVAVPGFEQIARNLRAAFPPNWDRCMENLRAAGRAMPSGRLPVPSDPGGGS